MAMELSDKHWKLVFSDGLRSADMRRGYRMELVEAIKKAKEKFGLSPETGVVRCYEAGRDGFWLHRYLMSRGNRKSAGGFLEHRDQPAEAAGQDRQN